MKLPETVPAPELVMVRCSKCGRITEAEYSLGTVNPPFCNVIQCYGQLWVVQKKSVTIPSL